MGSIETASTFGVEVGGFSEKKKMKLSPREATVEQVLVGGLLWLDDWVENLGSALVETCWERAHWENRGRCVGSQGRNTASREAPCEQNELPPIVNIMRISLAKSWSVR